VIIGDDICLTFIICESFIVFNVNNFKR